MVPALSPREVVRAFEKFGWEVARQRGCHIILTKGGHNSKDLMGKEKMKTLEKIKQILSNNKEELVRKYKIKEIGIFGSYVRGEEEKTSDVDILVEFEEEGKTFDNYMDLKFFLEDTLSVKVDLVMKGAIKESLRPYILREVIYA